MIEHCVFLKLHADADLVELQETLDGLDHLTEDMSGFLSFRAGPNRDFEGKSSEYPWGFVATFTDAAALQEYASDPRHQALGARLVAQCAGGGDGIMVFDLAVEAPHDDIAAMA
ncbi:MAG: Dabb family protein [Pseudoruegeria sp.]